MREIFGQATKNIDKYRSTISSQEQTISRSNDELAEANLHITDLTSTVATQKHDYTLLTSELKELKSSYQFECDQQESCKRQLSNQLEQTKNDYEQYKKRAHQLLQQKSDQKDDTRLGDLQSQLKNLEMMKIEYQTENVEQARKIELLNLDLRQSLDHIRELQTTRTMYIDNMKELDENRLRVDQLEKQVKKDRADYDKSLKSVSESYEATIQQLKSSIVLKSSSSDLSQQVEIISKTSSDSIQKPKNSQQQEEESAMDSIMEYLNEDNGRLRQLLNEKEQICIELQQKVLDLQQRYQQNDDDDDDKGGGGRIDPRQQANENDNHVDVYESMMQLLSPLVSRQETPGADMEKQVSRLKDMLQESEDQIAALRKQEKLLKDEVRKLDSVDKRQNMSVEYIKNVLLKFLTSENKEVLVPVLAKVLFLDPSETEQLQKAV
ncbi:unnamed protein product [Absidia cylindrospora]